ncbi:MAG: hypothetical protein ABIE55_00905 [Candidatus Aenigmatarchaeota archaeon]
MSDRKRLPDTRLPIILSIVGKEGKIIYENLVRKLEHRSFERISYERKRIYLSRIIDDIMEKRKLIRFTNHDPPMIELTEEGRRQIDYPF